MYDVLYSLSALRKKTENCGWKGGEMDGRQRMRKEREREEDNEGME